MRFQLTAAVCTSALFCAKSTSNLTCTVKASRTGIFLAGVYDESDQLLQQLFDVSDDASSASASNATAKFGVPATFAECILSGGCSVHAFAADPPSYTWEGALCTTGQQTGMNVWVGLNAVEDFAIAGSVAAFAHAYAEQDSSLGTVALNDTTTPLPIGHPDYHRLFNLAATDGDLAYYANIGLVVSNTSFFYIPTTFIVAYNLSNRCEHNFTVGGREECENGYGQGNCTIQWDGCNGGGSYWSSTLDWAHTPNEEVYGMFPDSATGLAVQRMGNLLAVAHGLRTDSNLRLFDKVTGASLCNYTVAAPRSIAFSPTTGRLWAVLGANVVSAYDLPSECSSDPLTPVLTLPVDAVALAGGITVAKGSDRLFVVDMGTSQVKIFDGSSGTLVSTVGQPGGYADGNTTVTTEKLWFLPPIFGAMANASHLSRGSFVAVDESDAHSEGLWVNDFGNRRILHLDSVTGSELPGSIAYIPSTYRSAVHVADPSRVFANFLEFSVDYSIPGASGWSLVRNWGAGLPVSYQANAYDVGPGRWEWAGFQAIGWSESLGLTVGVVDCYPNAASGSEDGYVLQAVLLDNETQSLVFLQNFSYATGNQWFPSLHTDATMRWTADHTSEVPSDCCWQEVWEAQLVLNASGTGLPGWEWPGRIVASFNVSTNSSNDFMARTGGVSPRYPVTSNGIVVLLDATTKKNGGNHLGGAAYSSAATATGLLWTASPWANWTLVRNYTVEPDGLNISTCFIGDADGRYGAANPGTNYAAGFPTVVGSDIIFDFFGEGWEDWEANQFLHFTDSGLFVGQFGTLNFPTNSPDVPTGKYHLPGAAGNAFAPSFFRDPVTGRAFYIHNDENNHGGLHLWSVTGGGLERPLEEMQVTCSKQ